MKQSIIKQGVPFTQVANRVIEDPSLSWKAKGLFSYLYSKPEGWDFSVHRIVKESKDGMQSLLAGIKELEVAGYLDRRRLANGRMEYYIAFEPHSENQNEESKASFGKPQQGKTHMRVSRTVSNTDLNNTDNISNTDLAKGEKSPLPVNEVIDLFKEVNPSYGNLFRNKTQRSAAERLLKKWTLEQIAAVVKILPSLNADPFAKGKSITPLQMETNLGFIKGWIEQKKTTNQPKGVRIS